MQKMENNRAVCFCKLQTDRHMYNMLLLLPLGGLRKERTVVAEEREQRIVLDEPSTVLDVSDMKNLIIVNQKSISLI